MTIMPIPIPQKIINIPLSTFILHNMLRDFFVEYYGNKNGTL